VPTFSTNSRVKQQVERLNRLASQKLWDEWLATYQELVNDDRELVLPRDDEFLVGVRYHCHQLLAALPPAARQRYRALYDAEARRLYDKAAAENDGAGMREVYSRFRFTSHGPRALLWIANRALDEGRPELARVAYSRIAKEPGVTVSTLLRYALAADAAGKDAEARAVLDRVRKEFGAQPAQVAGQNLTGAAAADQVARAMKREEKAVPSGRAWPAFAGAGDRKMAATVSGGLKRLWEFAQPTTPGTPVGRGNQSVFVGSSYGTPRARFSFLSFPALAGDRAWIQGPRNLTALNLATGQPAWDQQDFVLAKDELPNDNSNPRTGGVFYPSGRPVQAAPSVEGPLLTARVPLAIGEKESGRWPGDFGIGVFDARSGRQLWRRIVGGDPRGIYFNIPTLQANTVFTGAATYKGGITEYSAVALDANTGEPLWTTYLGAGSDPLAVTDGSPAAVKDGLVWIESSLYTLNALDLITGEIRLIYHYDPGRRVGYRGGFDSSPPMTNEPISLIASAAGPIVFAPRWGVNVVAIDGASGKLLWASPKAPNEGTVGWLFGVDGKRAYVCGDHVQAINLADGAREWTWAPDVTSSMGYAALCGDRIYVPVESRIYVRAAADGKELEVLDAADGLGETPGFTALLGVDGMLLASTRDRVVAFGPK
jgi:outer membrane protein assembly factor BamB